MINSQQIKKGSSEFPFFCVTITGNGPKSPTFVGSYLPLTRFRHCFKYSFVLEDGDGYIECVG